jgi:hypothetical protein
MAFLSVVIIIDIIYVYYASDRKYGSLRGKRKLG